MPTPEDLNRIADMGFAIPDDYTIGEAQARAKLEAALAEARDQVPTTGIGESTLSPDKLGQFSEALRKISGTTHEMIEAQRRGAAAYTPGERQAQPDLRPDRTPYVCIDVETTGIDESYCQVIEFGAVIEDWVTPIEKLKSFRCYVYHDQIVGEPYALAMNATILKKLAKVQRAFEDVLPGDAPKVIGDDLELYVRPRWLVVEFKRWLKMYGIDVKQPILAAGKNFAGFDKPFLKRVENFDLKFFHRAIDPGMSYWNPDIDKVPPSTEECKKRAGIDGEVKHTTVEDAIEVIKLIRARHPRSVSVGDVNVNVANAMPTKELVQQVVTAIRRESRRAVI